MVSPLQSIVGGIRSTSPNLGLELSNIAANRENIETSRLNREIAQAGLDQERMSLQNQQKIRAASYVNRLGKQLLSVDESQWPSILGPNMQALQSIGYSPEVLRGMTREQVQGVVAQTEPLVAQEKAVKLGAGERLVGSETGRVIAEAGQDVTKTQPMIDKLRSRYDTFSKDLRSVDSAFRKINTAPENASGDMSLIFGYMKLLDPGSTVQEGEFASAEQAAGVPTRVLNIYNRLTTGERLSESQRAEFKESSKALYDAQVESTDAQVATILQQADQDGVSRAKVLGAKNLREFEKRAADRLIGSAVTEAPTEEDPVVFKSPEHGDVTESDIQETMRANNMTREQVLEALGG